MDCFKKAVDQYTYYTFTIDSLIDNEIDFLSDLDPKQNKIVKANILNARALRTLAALFEEESVFWQLFDNYMISYYSGLILEKQNSHLKSIYTLESFKAYALSKHAPAFIPAEGMQLLFEKKNKTLPIKKLLIPIFYGMQMLDDLEDFNTDLESKQHTYCISRVYSYLEKEGLTNESGLNRFEERVFYLSGIAQECNNFATNQFLIAKKQAQELELFNLIKWIDQMLAMLTHNQKIITEVSS